MFLLAFLRNNALKLIKKQLNLTFRKKINNLNIKQLC